MTIDPTPSLNAARLERTCDSSAELVWELWTTAAGLEKVRQAVSTVFGTF